MKHYKYIFIVFSILFITSCENKSVIKSEMDKFLNTTVELKLDSMVYAKTLINENESIQSYKMSDYSYVVYVDSLSCSYCAINHLADYTDLSFDRFINENNISILFILSPTYDNIHKVIDKLRKNNIMNDCVFIDTTAVFARSNHNLPKNTRLHTFFIDKSGKVLLIGSPLHNDKIMSLSLNVMSKN